MRLLLLLWLVITLAATLAAVAHAKQPHILVVVADDLGWDNVGWHRHARVNASENSVESREVQTPNMDALVRDGLKLERHYTYNYCSPSRSSLQSGRLPIHVWTENTNPISMNPSDPDSGFAGVPRNMTCLAEKLRRVGYRTHMTGKWDCGMATWRHTPMGRGFETFFGYYHHANDMWTQQLTQGTVTDSDGCRGDLVDLWNTSGPALTAAGTRYEEEMFLGNSLQVIEQHNVSEPLFLYHAFRFVHTPLQIPAVDEAPFDFIENPHRRRYAAMVTFMDRDVGALVKALQKRHMWADTLLVFSSDNGGPIYGAPWTPIGNHAGVFGAASNLPLRGGKTSNWEGGVRVSAFVAGGALPRQLRGKESHAIMHITDWYATLLEAAGGDLSDERAAAASLPDVDAVSHWKMLQGQQPLAQGRDELHLSEKALLRGDGYKVVTGCDSIVPHFFGEHRMCFDVHARGFGWEAVWASIKPGRDCSEGCLFNVLDDPNEDHELSTAQPEIRDEMMKRLAELNKGIFSPDRGQNNIQACEVFETRYSGFYGPFADHLVGEQMEIA